jgi:hypothetical protein
VDRDTGQRASRFQTWTNRATLKILQSGAKGAQLITVTRPATPSGNQQWRFVG